MIRLLFLSADPVMTSRTNLVKEFNDIDSQLRLVGIRNNFEIIEPHITSLAELQQTLLDLKPEIVHFSGYGSNSSSLVFQHAEITPEEVEPHVLSALFAVLNKDIRCIVLSMCYSEIQAKAISEKVDYVVGLPKEMSYEAANTFVKGYYQALGIGTTITEAFNFGLINLDNLALDKNVRPILNERGGIDSISSGLTEQRGLSPKKITTKNEIELGDLEKMLRGAINKPQLKKLITLKNQSNDQELRGIQSSIAELRKEYIKFMEMKRSSDEFYNRTLPILQELLRNQKTTVASSLMLSLTSLYDYMQECIFLRDIGDENQAKLLDKKISNGITSILGKLNTSNSR